MIAELSFIRGAGERGRWSRWMRNTHLVGRGRYTDNPYFIHRKHEGGGGHTGDRCWRNTQERIAGDQENR